MLWNPPLASPVVPLNPPSPALTAVRETVTSVVLAAKLSVSLSVPPKIVPVTLAPVAKIKASSPSWPLKFAVGVPLTLNVSAADPPEYNSKADRFRVDPPVAAYEPVVSVTTQVEARFSPPIKSFPDDVATSESTLEKAIRLERPASIPP